MKCAGEVLKQERERRGLTPEDIERATKIRVKLLLALEEGEYQKLPPPTFVRGFIKNYAEFLGLSKDGLLALYRREVDEKKTQNLIPRAVVSPIMSRLAVTPRLVLILFVVFILVGFFVYLSKEFTLLAGAPYLDLATTKDNIKITSSTIEVSGKTDPEAKLTINGQEVRFEDGGKFTTQISLSPGQNVIEVAAESKRGKKSEVKRTVFVVQTP